jgi:hypothetical protein
MIAGSAMSAPLAGVKTLLGRVPTDLFIVEAGEWYHEKETHSRVRNWF